MQLLVYFVCKFIHTCSRSQFLVNKCYALECACGCYCDAVVTAAASAAEQDRRCCTQRASADRRSVAYVTCDVRRARGCSGRALDSAVESDDPRSSVLERVGQETTV